MHSVMAWALWHNIWQQNYLSTTQLWDIIYPVWGTTVTGNRFDMHMFCMLKCLWNAELCSTAEQFWLITGKSLFFSYDVTYLVTSCNTNKKRCGNVTAGEKWKRSDKLSQCALQLKNETILDLNMKGMESALRFIQKQYFRPFYSIIVSDT